MEPREFIKENSVGIFNSNYLEANTKVTAAHMWAITTPRKIGVSGYIAQKQYLMELNKITSWKYASIQGHFCTIYIVNILSALLPPNT